MLIDDTHFSPISNGGWDEDHFLEFVVNNFRVTFLQHKHKKSHALHRIFGYFSNYNNKITHNIKQETFSK